MSCIRFNTPSQRIAQTAAAAADAVVHRSPAMTSTKIARLRLLAEHENPAIRSSVASSRSTPDDLFEALAKDPDESVRASVARNDATPCAVLGSLAEDPSEQVRSWLAVNFAVPAEAFERLAGDPSPSVRSLVAWKRGLAEV